MDKNIFGQRKDGLLRVPGGFQKPDMRKRMIELFDKLKATGHFQQFKSYQDWEEKTYKDDLEKAKEFVGE